MVQAVGVVQEQQAEGQQAVVGLGVPLHLPVRGLRPGEHRAILPVPADRRTLRTLGNGSRGSGSRQLGPATTGFSRNMTSPAPKAGQAWQEGPSRPQNRQGPGKGQWHGRGRGQGQGQGRGPGEGQGQGRGAGPP